MKINSEELTRGNSLVNSKLNKAAHFKISKLIFTLAGKFIFGFQSSISALEIRAGSCNGLQLLLKLDNSPTLCLIKLASQTGSELVQKKKVEMCKAQRKTTFALFASHSTTLISYQRLCMTKCCRCVKVSFRTTSPKRLSIMYVLVLYKMNFTFICHKFKTNAQFSK